MPLENKRPKVVILGGGFGGLYAAQALARAPVDVTLIDRRNFHLFQPLLYQVAMGQLSPANIAAPLRSILAWQRNVNVRLGEAVSIDVATRKVVLKDGAVEFDFLVVATGARHHYFNHPEWEHAAPGLKTIEDATEIRRRVLSAFEAAEVETDPERRRALLTFVVVGAGPTGVELAGTLAELAHYTMRGNFRSIDPAQAKILLVEGGDRVLAAYPPVLSAKAAKALGKLRVTVQTNSTVIDLHAHGLTIRRGDGTEEIRSETVLWAAGVEASPLGKTLANATGVPLDRAGRVIIAPDLSLPDHPNLFVIGDLAHCVGADGKPLPGVAPVAMQQGRHVADGIQKRLRNESAKPFRYFDRGSMATIGRSKAVADLGWIRFSGLLAWLAWLFIHLMYLAQFQNRVLVLFQWTFNYITGNRAARLITGEARDPKV